MSSQSVWQEPTSLETNLVSNEVLQEFFPLCLQSFLNWNVGFSDLSKKNVLSFYHLHHKTESEYFNFPNWHQTQEIIFWIKWQNKCDHSSSFSLNQAWLFLSAAVLPCWFILAVEVRQPPSSAGSGLASASARHVAQPQTLLQSRFEEN